MLPSRTFEGQQARVGGGEGGGGGGGVTAEDELSTLYPHPSTLSSSYSDSRVLGHVVYLLVLQGNQTKALLLTLITAATVADWPGAGHCQIRVTRRNCSSATFEATV